MKKTKLFLMAVVLLGLAIPTAKADTITYQRLDNLYYHLTVDGTTMSNHVNVFYLDGRRAYCVEPGTEIITKEYTAYTDWSNVDLTDEQIQYIEKIGYYGYEYPGHQTDRYHIATQELIWRAVKDVDVYFTDDSGNVVDISEEKQNILDLVNAHSTLPSFTNDTITGLLGQTITITDTNGVLENFEISDSKYHTITQDGNTLTITLNEQLQDEETITLTRKTYDSKTLLVYRYPNSQTIAALRLSTNENITFKIKNYEEEKEIEEVVPVPSTGETYKAINFGVYKFKLTDDRKFN